MDWREEAISSQHDRANFDCGSEELNDYLRRFARQNHDRGHTKTYVAVPVTERFRILGYYSITLASVDFGAVPESLTKRFPRYPIPAFRLARLAVHLDLQRRGLGSGLFFAAGRRCLRAAEEVGGFALLIDAKDEAAANWYRRLGAVTLLDSHSRLIMPLATISRTMEALASETTPTE